MLPTLGIIALTVGDLLADCTDGSRFPVSSDQTCQFYYECYSNVYYSYRCPEKQIFYPGYNQCVLEDSYDCVCDPPLCIRPDCSGHYNEDIVDSKNCSRYIYCNGAWPLRRSCDRGSIFVPDNRRCEQRSSTPYKCPLDPFQCPGTGRYAKLSDPNCQIYYDCSTGSPQERVCDHSFVFYEKLDRCVLPESYDCHDPDPFVCPDRDRDFADPKDPTLYYYCQGYVPLHRACQSGLTFNSNVRRCT